MSKQLDEKLSKLSPEELKLYKLRHTAEHVLHQAVKSLYPQIHLAMGPATEDGFYFDFDASPKGKKPVKVSEADFKAIEKKMRQIINLDLPMIQQEVSVEEARKLFAGNPYKLEWIDLIKDRGEKVSLYWTGKPGDENSMVDLCSGPHADSTDAVRAFKLLSVAGAYWHGDEKNKMLTRIYGTAFYTQAELDNHLKLLQEAKTRDHKKIGKQQELFLVSPDIGGGLPIFMPKGLIVRKEIENHLTNLKSSRGYQFVWTPNIAKSDIYVKSGHWKRYDAMFNPMKIDEDEYVVKPMNCPHHFQVFLERPRSYREFPIRIAENGTCYRYEKSGELNGLLRVRAVTIDDTHTFVRHNQIADEINNVLELIEVFFKSMGFPNYYARISTRDPDDDKYLGSDEVWKKAESALLDAVKKRRIDYVIGKGEAAFYGPKIDVMVKDAIGREWQLSTCQLDFNQPENFDMSLTNEKGEVERPAILHIAISGSIERFMGIIIEHYAGAFPVWLSPIQAVVIPITEGQHDYAAKIGDELKSQGVRAEVWHDDSMQKRIRQAERQKIPYMLIVGAKEGQDRSVSVRGRGEQDLGVMPTDKFAAKIKAEITAKTIN